MKMFKNKTSALGLVLCVLAFVSGHIPWLNTAVTLPPDVLLITGLGLIFGRDAIRKLQQGGET